MCGVLLDLFERQSATLVIKSDNGPVFFAEASKAMLSNWAVFSLLFLQRCGIYNAVCERANQTLKLMTAQRG